MIKTETGFQAKVNLPYDTDVVYKFVVDGQVCAPCFSAARLIVFPMQVGDPSRAAYELRQLGRGQQRAAHAGETEACPNAR